MGGTLIEDDGLTSLGELVCRRKRDTSLPLGRRGRGRRRGLDADGLGGFRGVDFGFGTKTGRRL